MNTNGVYTLSIEDIRVACGYEKTDNIRQVYRRLFGAGEINWKEKRKAADLLPLLEELATPNSKKSAKVTSAALRLIREITSLGNDTETVKEEAAEVKAETRTEVVSPTKDHWFMAWAKKEFEGFSELDLAFYICMGVGVYGLFFFLKVMGLLAGLLYVLLSRHALKMTKNRHSHQTAERGINLVWALELASFFVHLSMFNLALWQSGKDGQLPFSVWENPAYCFWVAVPLALLFSGGGVYAVTTSLALLDEKARATEYEENNDGLKW